MAKVTFRNILNDNSEFKEVDEEYLLPSVYEYARTLGNDEVYSVIMKEKIVIYVDNKYVKTDDWGVYKLEKDSEIIVSPEVLGGDSGAWFQIALGVVLIAIAWWNPVGWIGAGALFTQATATSVMLMGAALALGGISSLLFKPDMPTLDFRGSGKSQTYNWSGIKTMAQEDTPIPVVYGTHKVGGNLISLFTERYGEDDQLYMLIALSEGEIDGICLQDNYASVCTTSDPTSAMYRTPAIELDDQPISDYNYVNWWYRKGVNATDITKTQYDPSSQNRIPGFDGSKTQFDDGRDITSTGVVYTTTKEVDRAILQIRAPALYNAANPEVGLREEGVVYRVKYRKEGTSTWYDYYPFYWTPSVTTGTKANGASITTPSTNIELSFTRSAFTYFYSKPQTWTFKILNISPDGPSQGWVWYDTDVNITFKDYTITIEGTNDVTNEIVTKQAILRTTRTQYSEQVYVLVSALDNIWEWQTRYYWGPTIFHYPSITIGEYTITCKEHIAIGDTYTMSVASGYQTTLDIAMYGKTKTGVWSSVLLNFNEMADAVGKEMYEIKVYRPYGDKSTNMQIEDNILLHSVVEIVDGEFIYPNVALLGFSIKASDQLSGSPPNVTTIIRGLKVKVPDLEDTSPTGTNVLFDNCYWDSAQNRWEDAAGNEVFWNNSSSWRSEFSNNSMLCVKDLMLSKRYGLGEYINERDLYTTGINNIIKLCHVSYEPTEGDHVSWWTSNDSSTFDSHIHITQSENLTVAVSNVARTITFSGSYNLNFYVDLDSPLHMDQTYQISITLGSLTRNVNINARLCDSSGVWTTVGSQITNVGDSEQTISFTANKSGYTQLGFIIQSYATSSSVNGIVSDVSLNRTSTKKLHYHTFDGVMDNAQSALAALLEMCDSFRVWPIWYEGKFNFIMNKDDTPVQTLSRGNTTELTQTFTALSEIPSRLIGQYTDADRRWEMKSLVARSSDNTLVKINEKNIGLKGITNRKKAERELKFKLNQVTNCTHVINTKAGLDSIHFTAGDIFYVQDDLPQWGQGGRVLSYAATSLESDIIGWWKLNEGSGTTIADSSGQGNNGTLYNTDAGDWIDCIHSYGLYFNQGEASEYGEVADATVLDTIKSFSCWVHPISEKSHATTYHILVSKHTSSNWGMYIDYASSPNKFWVWFEDSTGALSGSSYTIPDYNKWYHLTGVFTSNNTALLYVNGLPQTEGAVITNNSGVGTAMSGASLKICGGVTNRYSTVKIDEILVFNRALTQEEIIRLHKYPPKGLYISTEDVITISDRSATNIVRYQTVDNSFVTATLNTATVPTATDSHYLKVLGYPSDKTPKDDAVFATGKSGSFSKKFRAVSTIRNKQEEIEITAIEHLSELYTSEPTITVVEDQISALPNPLLRPDPPQNVSVTPNLYFEGFGFTLYAEPPTNVGGIQEIIVQMKKDDENESSYEIITTIPTTKRFVNYSNDKLELDTLYNFRFTCRTQFKTSNPVTVSCEMVSAYFTLPSPTGLRLKDNDPNSNIFDGKDITIEWNPVNYPSTILDGYRVGVYRRTYGLLHHRYVKLRESFVKDSKYTYTFENLIEDTGGAIYGSTARPLYFFVWSLNVKGAVSAANGPFIVYNDIPENVTSLTANPTVGGVRFAWAKSTELDHKAYDYCTKIGSGAWSTATKIAENNITRYLTSTEITTYGNKPSIYIKVKDFDWYKQLSATYVTVSASANLLSDNLFQILVTKSSGVSGTNASIYDNITSSGGVVIA